MGVITATFLYLPWWCPCRLGLISACGDWQSRPRPPNNPPLAFFFFPHFIFQLACLPVKKNPPIWQFTFDSLRGWSHDGRKKTGYIFLFSPKKVKSQRTSQVGGVWQGRMLAKWMQRGRKTRTEPTALYIGFRFLEFLKDMGESLILIQHGRLQLIFQSH